MNGSEKVIVIGSWGETWTNLILGCFYIDQIFCRVWPFENNPQIVHFLAILP